MGWLGWLTHSSTTYYHAADLQENELQIGWFRAKIPQKQLQYRYFATAFATDRRSELLDTYARRIPKQCPKVPEAMPKGWWSNAQRLVNFRSVPRMGQALSTRRFASIDVLFRLHRRIVSPHSLITLHPSQCKRLCLFTPRISRFAAHFPANRLHDNVLW